MVCFAAHQGLNETWFITGVSGSARNASASNFSPLVFASVLSCRTQRSPTKPNLAAFAAARPFLTAWPTASQRDVAAPTGRPTAGDA